MKRIRLGELLLEHKLVDEATLEQASQLQKESGKKFGRTLVDMGAINEEKMLRLLAEQLDVPFIDLTHYDIDTSLLSLLPETYARRYRALLLGEIHGKLQVGLADPLDIYAFDELAKLLDRPISIAVVCESLLLSVIDKVYRRTQEISHFAEELSGEMIDEKDTESLFAGNDDGDDAPVVKLLQSIFKDAAQSGASDIHIEPDDKVLRIRFRIDGLLQENVLDDNRIASALVQRLKLRANLDISEKRIPQDGRFNLKLQGHAFDVRVSTMPIANGESVVMRLLNQSSPVTDLSRLGIDTAMEERLIELYSRPHGMLLVTGPTGSGKTTTLYSLLTRLNKAETKIITVEDPVEYRLPRINQVQVNKKIGLDFAIVLRAVLRQDPDVLMVGEIRDLETAQIAMRAAVTGHLVLATLHTNDAISTAMRLVDMGGEGYMVASAVNGIIAQRLLRINCEVCVGPHTASSQEQIWLDSAFKHHNEKQVHDEFKQGRGCTHCNYSGYKGRIGVYELLELNDELLTALRNNDTDTFAKQAKLSSGYKPLSSSVFSLVKRGIISIAEAMRVSIQLDGD